MMSRPYWLLFLRTLQYKLFNKNSNRIPHYQTGPTCLSQTSFPYWSSVLKTHTSFSKVSNMSRYMVQPWVPPSVPSLPSCSWKSLRSKLFHPPHLSKVCWWNLCHSKGRTQYITTTAYQHTGPSHTVHNRRIQPARITTILGHSSFTGSQQHTHHHSLQETNTHRSISSLGEQPLHMGQTQCIQHSCTQGQNSVTWSTSITPGIYYIKAALQACHFPTWTLNRLQQRFEQHHQTSTV